MFGRFNSFVCIVDGILFKVTNCHSVVPFSVQCSRPFESNNFFICVDENMDLNVYRVTVNENDADVKLLYKSNKS